jgi:hypothetical protein
MESLYNSFGIVIIKARFSEAAMQERRKSHGSE